MDNIEQPSNEGENSSDRETTLSTRDTSNDESGQGNSTVHSPSTAPSSVTSATSLYDDLRHGTSSLRGEKKQRVVTRDTSSTLRKSTLEDTKFRHALSPRRSESSEQPVSSTSFEDDSSNRVSLRKSGLEGTKYNRVLVHQGGSASTGSSLNDNSHGKVTCNFRVIAPLWPEGSQRLLKMALYWTSRGTLTCLERFRLTSTKLKPAAR